MKTLSHFIKGHSYQAEDESYLPVKNPAIDEVIAQVPDAGESTLEAAVTAAQSAWPEWAELASQSRANYLNRLADLIEEKSKLLAQLESENTGKPLALAQSVDIPRAAQNFRFFAQAATQFSSECHAMTDQTINYTRRDPLGVVACIAPWNLPLYLLTWKIAPALAMGNCVVAKPSEITPLTADVLADLCQAAQLPPGVLNILHGQGAKVGAALCRHPGIKAISFTGGTETGRQVAVSAASHFKKVSLELGGKNPALIFADCDLDETVRQLVRASFANQGQICLCPSRLIIEESIYELFKAKFVQATQALTVGDPSLEVNLGAVVSRAHQHKILSLIESARAQGGHILCGGDAVKVSGPCQNGAFVAPTVIEGLSMAADANQQEIFGPVVTLTSFKTTEEALALANGTEYGLAATVWTQDLKKAHVCAEALATGIVWVNCWMLRDLRTPFGGVKNSGQGREGGIEVLRFFTEPKNVCIHYG